MARNLCNMVVLITGASSGIGAALARELHLRGARLALAARRVERLQSLNTELGGQHLVVATDVSKAEQCAEFIERAQSHFGQIDTLICNAGYGIHQTVARTSIDEAQAIFQTNVFGTLDCIRAVTPIMQAQPPLDGWAGQIMIVSSCLARRGLPFYGAYSATKSAQLSLAEAMRVELAPSRIAVTTVHPVGTDTEFGEASARASEGRRAGPIPGEKRQSAATVAQAMVIGIERPRPEVWPMRSSRWGLSLATLLPRVTDRILANRREALAMPSQQ